MSKDSGSDPSGSRVQEAGVPPVPLRHFLEAYPLTDREREVVVMVLRGMSNKEIASEFSIAEQTVKDHLKHVYGKVGVHQRTALCAKVFGLAK